jgi:hypothetical protein
MAATEELLTAEEFEQLPDDGKLYELIDGQLREILQLTMWQEGSRQISRCDGTRMSRAVRWAV